ncbi:MAG: hypothetical protein WBA89_22035 [Microcoleus sp.]
MTYAKNPSMWYCCKVLVGEPYKQSLCISPLNFWAGRNLLEICQKFARNLPEICQKSGCYTLLKQTNLRL